MVIKKNELATFVVYIGMLAIALLVALFIIRPVVTRTGSAMQINFIALVILGLISGVLLNAFILEGGHALGAKAGKNRIYRWNLLGFTFDFKEGSKKPKFRFSAPEGLIGDTAVLPLDREKSTLSAYILFPFLGIIIEVIGFMIMVVNGNSLIDRGQLSNGWLVVFGQVNLAVTGMMVLYDIFPARLESITDGFLLTLLTKPANKLAYNDILVQEYQKYNKLEVTELPVYTEVSDFTYQVNAYTALKKIEAGKLDEAIKIYDLAINTERGLIKAKKYEATCAKFVLLCLTGKARDAKLMYEGFSDQIKSYIGELSNLSSGRTYLLVSGLFESSQDEADYVLGKFERMLKNTEKDIRPIEIKLIENCLTLIASNHPSWNLEFEYHDKDEEEEEVVEEETSEETIEEVEEIEEEIDDKN